jgi:hypothetical protein
MNSGMISQIRERFAAFRQNRNFRNFEFIFTFTTGRSGTGFLSQVFGHGSFEKKTVHQTGDALVTHESWKNLPIPQLKRLSSISKEAQDLCAAECRKKFDELISRYPATKRFLVADHRVGRFFVPPLHKSSVRCKVIRIHRQKKEVLASFIRIYEQRKKDTSPDVFKRLYQNNWTRNYYAPSDFSTIGKVEASDWHAMDHVDRFRWYIEEVERQWSSIRPKLNPAAFIEVDFSELVSEIGLQTIENFISIPYSRQLSCLRANHQVRTDYG